MVSHLPGRSCWPCSRSRSRSRTTVEKGGCQLRAWHVPNRRSAQSACLASLPTVAPGYRATSSSSSSSTATRRRRWPCRRAPPPRTGGKETPSRARRRARGARRRTRPRASRRRPGTRSSTNSTAARPEGPWAPTAALSNLLAEKPTFAA